MNIFYELYLEILFKGDQLIKDKKHIPDYFKFMMGIIAGTGLSLFILTDYTSVSLSMIITAYLLFYFVKENFEANPTMILNIKSDQPAEEIMKKLDKHFEDK